MIVSTLQDLTTRQITALIFLGVSFIFGIVSAYIVNKKNPNYPGNNFTARAFILLSLASITNAIYTLVTDATLIDFFHRFTITSAFVGTLFLYLAANYIRIGDRAFEMPRIGIILAFGLLSSLALIFLPDSITIYLDATIDDQLVEQFIEWSLPYYGLAMFSTYVMSLGTVYEYHLILKDIPNNSVSLRKAMFLVMLGLIVLIISYFFMVTPHILLNQLDISLLRLSANIGSFGIFLGFVLIFFGFNTKESKTRDQT